MAIDPDRTFKPINIAVLTVSDSRTSADDTSGDILAQRIRDAGHTLAARAIEKDDADVLVNRFNTWWESGEVGRQWQRIRGPLKGVAIVVAVLLALRVYATVVSL